MIDTTISTFGKIDVLHNNAANTNLNDAAKDISLLDFNVDIFHKNMDINVLGGVLASQYALPHMLEAGKGSRSEEHTSELQSLMRISYAVFCLKKKTTQYAATYTSHNYTRHYVRQDTHAQEKPHHCT